MHSPSYYSEMTLCSKGLVSEVEMLREIASKYKNLDSGLTSPVDYTLGIYQSIGQCKLLV